MKHSVQKQEGQVMPRSSRHPLHKSLLIAFCVFGLIGCAGLERFGERGVRQAPQPSVSSPAPSQSPPLDPSQSAVTEMPLGSVSGSNETTQPTALPPSAQEGPTVALLLPLSANGQVGELAQAMKNAAELAQSEYKGAKLRLSVKDDQGSAEGARTAARAALTEGAQVFLGPILSSSVQAAAGVTRPAGKTLIGFSTDQTVAGRGVYLLSFQPDTDVDQILAYASAKGKTSIAAIIPEGVYGNVILAAFQEAAGRRGLKIATIERYHATSVDNAARAVAALTVPVDALFIPDNGEAAQALNTALLANGIDRKHWQILGTSAWDDPRLLKESVFQSGWFAGPDKSGFTGFSARYRARFGKEPPRLASLGYDAVFLVNALFAQYGEQAFSETTLRNPDGMIGTDGLFRFRNNGGIQRMLAIYEVTNGTTKLLQDPPTRF
jgi:ABC-type branched-subunit amino acid transport system substrate-binding protein